LIAAALAIGATVGGCTATHPFVRNGDANSVEITYGGDVAGTLPLARRHCAQYGRVARFLDAGGDVAAYECVRP
jgi:hypothetical protein